MGKNEVKPWDLLNPNTDYITKDVADQRYKICQSCAELIKLSKQCKRCGCFMVIKTKLEKAECPIGKW